MKLFSIRFLSQFLQLCRFSREMVHEVCEFFERFSTEKLTFDGILM